MAVVLQILEFIVALGALAFLHELGHFLGAKLFKIEIEEFGFGFPPRLVKLFNFGGTEFTLNWIPFGAFVRPKGENDPDIPGSLAAANPWARLVVLLSGPIMNIIAGIFIFTLIFNRVGITDPSIVLIGDVSINSPAASAGLQSGDTIIKVNDQVIDRSDRLVQIVQQNKGKEITIKFTRAGQEYQIHIVPRVSPPEGQGALGITMTNPIVKTSWYKTIPFAGYMAYIYGREMLLLPAHLLEGSVKPEQARMVSPKGIYDMFSQMQTRDQQATANNEPPERSVNTLNLMAIISLALGLTNLLPIPALDGGKIIFVLPEIIFHKRIPARYENMVHTIGFISLLALQFYIMIQDFINPIVIP